jgi:hypothetical protein
LFGNRHEVEGKYGGADQHSLCRAGPASGEERRTSFTGAHTYGASAVHSTEDYFSDDDHVWESFFREHTRSRAYRWGEDGLLVICDDNGFLCFSLALWNEKDPIIKERAFEPTNREGNQGEDVKEYYYYLGATPTASYLKALYKVPPKTIPLRMAGLREPAPQPLRTRVRKVLEVLALSLRKLLLLASEVNARDCN